MSKKRKEITAWKKRLILGDIEKYLMGQITLKQIAINRNVPYSRVVLINAEVVIGMLKKRTGDV